MASTKLDLREVNKDFFFGLIKLHILYHAVKADVFDQELVGKLSKHGYRLEVTVVRRLLYKLEQTKYIEINKRAIDHSVRDYYRATRKGRGVLRISDRRIRELFKEFVRGAIDDQLS